MAKPTKFPDWAVNDVVNPNSTENNVVEPGAAKKLLGWDFKEFPPRQYFNWLSRLTNDWIQWFDSLLDQSVKTTASPTFDSLTVSSGLLDCQSISATVVTCNSINTGQGNVECYAMDQAVQTTDDVTFNDIGTYVDYSTSWNPVGWSSFVNKILLYKKIGKFVWMYFLVDGASNSANASAPLPFTSIPAMVASLAIAEDNQIIETAPGYSNVSGNTITFHRNDNTPWTATGPGKKVVGQIFFKIA